jgi:hypothetical protein
MNVMLEPKPVARPTPQPQPQPQPALTPDQLKERFRAEVEQLKQDKIRYRWGYREFAARRANLRLKYRAMGMR